MSPHAGLGMTGAQMCDVIARWLLVVDGIAVAPRAIWEMDPSGELWPVFELFEQADAWIRS
jgi:hypothetical protein